MRREFSYQDMDLFFAQFKSMPEYINLEQVNHFILHPKTTSSYNLKGSSFRLWIILITAAAIITTSTVLFFSLSGSSKQNQGHTNLHEKSVPPAKNNPVTKADSSETVSQKNSRPGPIFQTKSDELNSATKKVADAENNEIIVSEKSVDQNFSNKPLNGNPYIIDDLSLEELRKLGFDIQHYFVFYKNTRSENKCIYVSKKENMSAIYYESIGKKQKTQIEQLLDLDTLIRDTLQGAKFYIRIYTERIVYGQPPTTAYYHFKETEKDYYPVYISKLNGSVMGIQSSQKFDLSKDTLVPVVFPFSRLNCKQNQDLIFWFHATEDFYNDIPDRHNQIQSFISNNKRNKKTIPNVRLVNYDIESWISSILYPPDKVIDGTDFILNLSREEKQRIGLFRKKENDKLLYYSYQTPWGRGAGLGGKTTWSKTKNNSGRDSVQCIEYDTTLIVDYLPKMLTDTLGYPKTMSTTGYYIQSSLVTDDHLIPVKHSDVIFWFTQSDSLWTLLPDRYRYLQKIYQRIFFTKSLYPDIDLVRYFEQGRKQIDMDVEILDLSNSELENIGFQFIRDSLATQTSVYNNEWIQIQFNLPGMVLKMLNDGISHFLNFSGLRGGIQIVNEKNKDFKKEHNGLEYDELMKSPFQGFQFVMVTDELGNELVNFRSLARNEYLSGSESQYLIPVRVPFDKYFSEYSETKIFWFTPTEEFFDRLPDRISKNLRQDFYSLIGNLETSSCTYFEECRSTLQLDDFLIYPNPARERITVSFNAADKVTGNIHLLDIKGSIVKKLEAQVNITNGNNEFHYILNDVQPGIYLVAVQSDKGIKTARLIVYE